MDQLNFTYILSSPALDLPLPAQRHPRLPKPLTPIPISRILTIQLQQQLRAGQLPRVITIELSAQGVLGMHNLGWPVQPGDLALSPVAPARVSVLDRVGPSKNLGGRDVRQRLEPWRRHVFRVSSQGLHRVVDARGDELPAADHVDFGIVCSLELGCPRS